MKKDLRKFARIPSVIPVFVRNMYACSEADTLLRTQLKNISEGGIYVMDCFHPVLTLLDIRISLPAPDGGSIHATGIVQYNDGEGIGVKFLEIDDDSMEKLLSVVDIKRSRKTISIQTG